MQTIKTYSNRVPFYNALIRTDLPPLLMVRFIGGVKMHPLKKRIAVLLNWWASLALVGVGAVGTVVLELFCLESLQAPLE